MFVDFIIKLIRLPLAMIAAISIIIITVLGTIIELPIALIYLIFLSIFSGKSTINDSWLSDVPNSTSNTLRIIRNLFRWGTSPDSTLNLQEELIFSHKDSKKAFVVFNGLSAILVAILLITVLELWWFFIIIAMLVAIAGQ